VKRLLGLARELPPAPAKKRVVPSILCRRGRNVNSKGKQQRQGEGKAKARPAKAAADSLPVARGQ
jgi:hypothetical protein